MNNNNDDKNKLSTLIPSTDVIQLTLTLKMTTAQVVKTSVTGTRQQSYSGLYTPEQSYSIYSRLPIIQTLKGNWKSSSYLEFKLLRVKLYGK